jgi:hypothetical protein
MQQLRGFRGKYLWKTQACLTLASLIALSLFFVSDVQAEQLVTVRVQIVNVANTICDDGLLGPGDIFFKVTADGITKNNKGVNDIEANLVDLGCHDWNDLTNPREFSWDVDLSKGTIPIRIEAWDNDEGEFAGGDDDVCPLLAPTKDYLDISLNLSTCKITGDAIGDCGQRITITGDDSCIAFKIDVTDPAHAPGLNVRCLHDPIWPDPGQEVTITAEALDDDANLITKGKVDNIEIWIDDKTKPYATTVPSGVNTTSVKYTPPSGAEQITYGCRVLDEGQRVFTGWRVVQIGQPKKGRAVPILYTGPRASRVDIVFIANDDDFTGGNDPQFLPIVHNLIRDGYYAGASQTRNGGRLFLINQDALNFWIALDQAHINPANGIITPPDNWAQDYNFAEAGVLLHANFGLRDHAGRSIGIFSTEITNLLPSPILLHETGHTPFGLSDEYCDMKLTYHVADPYPNIYDDPTKCLEDPLASTIQDACQQIQENTSAHPNCKVNYYRLDGASTYFDDLMTDMGHLTPNPADKRRIDWLFDKCTSARCD